MRYPRDSDPELTTAIQRFVNPTDAGKHSRYLRLLHGNVLGMQEPERAPFIRSLAEAALLITDQELSTLLDSEWRSKITAAWLIGLDHRTQFRSRIGEMLMKSELCFAGQGYCFALARFADAEDADILSAYLDVYLPQLDCFYDQHWAIGALQHIDELRATTRTSRFLRPGGPWHPWAQAHGNIDPAEQRLRIDQLCSFAKECMRTELHDTPDGPMKPF